MDQLVVLMRLASAAHSLVSADLSLVQGLTAEQQVSIESNINEHIF